MLDKGIKSEMGKASRHRYRESLPTSGLSMMDLEVLIQLALKVWSFVESLVVVKVCDHWQKEWVLMN